MAAVQEALQIAFDHHMSGRLAEAEVIYARILDVVPDHTEALHLSGLAAQAGRLDDGGRQLRRAVATGPDRADIHKNLGNLCKANGAVGAAAARYRAELAARPDDRTLLRKLATALEQAGDGGAPRRPCCAPADSAAICRDGTATLRR